MSEETLNPHYNKDAATPPMELGVNVLRMKARIAELGAALETESGAATLYAKQLAHWIEKHDLVNAEVARLSGHIRAIASHHFHQDDTEYHTERRDFALSIFTKGE